MPKIVHADTATMINVMGRLDIFENSSRIELQRMFVEDTLVFMYEKGEYIITKGDLDSSFFIILSGSVVIMNNKEIMARVKSGKFIGEMSFLTKEPRTANAIASERTLVLRIEDSVMGHLHVQVIDKIKDKIIQRLVRHIKKMNDLLDPSK